MRRNPTAIGRVFCFGAKGANDGSAGASRSRASRRCGRRWGTPRCSRSSLPEGTGRFWLKAEWLNPGGSVKDRAARGILRDALAPGAAAGPAAARRLERQHRHRLRDARRGGGRSTSPSACPATPVPSGAALLEVYGAEVVVTDRMEGTEGAAPKARELADADARSVLLRRPVQQSGQPGGPPGDDRPRALVADRRPDHPFRGGDGDHGNHDGHRWLPEGAERRRSRWSGVQPDSPYHGLEGLKHLATTSQPPALYDPALPDVVAEIPTETADRTARWLARSAGYLVGWSAGAAVAAAMDIVRREPDAVRGGHRLRHRRPLPERAAPLGGRHDAPAAGRARRRDPPPRRGGVPGRVLRRAGGPGGGRERRRCCGSAPAVNRRTDDPHRYLIAPDDLRRLEREVREAGPEIVGYYHSHPDHPAAPSAFDAEHAWPWYSYLIVRIDRGRGADLASWVLDDERPAHASRVPRRAQRGVTMSVTVSIPTPLRSFTGGRDAVELAGGTVGEVLDELLVRARRASSAISSRTTGGCATS